MSRVNSADLDLHRPPLPPQPTQTTNRPPRVCHCHSLFIAHDVKLHLHKPQADFESLPILPSMPLPHPPCSTPPQTPALPTLPDLSVQTKLTDAIGQMRSNQTSLQAPRLTSVPSPSVASTSTVLPLQDHDSPSLQSLREDREVIMGGAQQRSSKIRTKQIGASQRRHHQLKGKTCVKPTTSAPPDLFPVNVVLYNANHQTPGPFTANIPACLLTVDVKVPN